MGKRGPAPTPTPLKVLRGNPGKRAINKNEPKPKPVAPKPPSWLDQEAKKIWRKLAPKLESIGCLTEVDWPDFAALCSAIARFKVAQTVLKEKGLVMVIERYNKEGEVVGEYEQQRPEVSIVHKNSELIAKLSAKFGLSPADRVSLSVQQETEDDLMEFLKSRGKKNA